MKLNQKQVDKLWGDGGPYSEARLIIETRILDNSVSRVIVRVEVSINPLTFEIIKKNIKHFADDDLITNLVTNARYYGPNHGYVAEAFFEEYVDDTIIKKGREALEYCKDTIVKMHHYVIDLLGLPI